MKIRSKKSRDTVPLKRQRANHAFVDNGKISKKNYYICSIQEEGTKLTKNHLMLLSL
jgi:hypothetical protein